MANFVVNSLFHEVHSHPSEWRNTGPCSKKQIIEIVRGFRKDKALAARSGHFDFRTDR